MRREEKRREEKRREEKRREEKRREEKRYIDVHGSCVSRGILNHFNNDEIEVNLNMSRQCLVSAMMPPVNLPTNIENLLPNASEYQNRCLKYSFDKSTLPRLLDSNSEYLIIDLFDLCQNVVTFENTTFSNYDTLFYVTKNYKNNSKKMGNINFFDVPTSLWYGYVDIYFQNIVKKYKQIILCRLQCCNNYISISNEINPITGNKLFFGNAKYNNNLRKLEQYIIDKYPVITIDLTKYFISDENFNKDTTPVHYEELYLDTSKIVLEDILFNENPQQCYDLPLDVIPKILRKDLNDENYIKFHKSKKSPFFSLGFLNSFFIDISDAMIIENRYFIADIYEHAVEFFNEDNDHYNLDNWNNFLLLNSNLFNKSEYLSDIHLKAIKLIEQNKNSSVDNLLNIIKTKAMNKDNNWVIFLNLSYCLYKDNSEINLIIKNFRNL